VLLVFTFGLFANAGNITEPLSGAYFPNWAHYRANGHAFYPQNMTDLLGNTINVVYYGFAFFCPPADVPQAYWVDGKGRNGEDVALCANKNPYEVVLIDVADEAFISNFTYFRDTLNKQFKFVLSIGSWNFPSQYYSRMVANATARGVFIKSCQDMMQTYGFDGIDIDWEYPGSPPRNDSVKISCANFQLTVDLGGDLANDKTNLISLLKEMRQAFGNDKLITVCGQADPMKADNAFDFTEIIKYVDMINLMVYDYSVSMTNGNESKWTAPNQPLYAPVSGGSKILQDSIENTTNYYLDKGVPSSQLSLGLALYGHTWLVPGLSQQNDWAKFGITAQLSTGCCKAWNMTYGSQPGQYCIQCGMFTIDEIEAAGFDTYFDTETQTNIGYLTQQGDDGYTWAGTWVSYQGSESITALSQFAANNKLQGIFVFDISMDIMSNERTTFTFNMTKLAYQTFMDTYKHDKQHKIDPQARISVSNQ
jgi:GH18 family chitinase